MSQFLVAFLIAALTPLLLRWLMRKSKDQPAASASIPDGSFVVKPSVAHRRLILGCFAAMLILCGILAVETLQHWQLAAAFTPALLAPFALAVYALRRKVVVSKSGLSYHSPWTRVTFISWSQIEAVRFREWGQTVRIRAAGKDIIVIPVYYAGIAELEQSMCAHLAPAIVGSTFEKYRAYVESL